MGAEKFIHLSDERLEQHRSDLAAVIRELQRDLFDADTALAQRRAAARGTDYMTEIAMLDPRRAVRR